MGCLSTFYVVFSFFQQWFIVFSLFVKFIPKCLIVFYSFLCYSKWNCFLLSGIPSQVVPRYHIEFLCVYFVSCDFVKLINSVCVYVYVQEFDHVTCKQR
jgi:hypothetical protein